jgi:hypothetical protein
VFKLDRIRFLALLPFILFPVLRDGPLNTNLWDYKLIFVVVATCLAIRINSARSAIFQNGKVLFLLLNIMCLTIISFILSTNHHVSWNMTAAFLANATVLILIISVISIRWIARVFVAVGLLTSLACFIAMLQYVTVKFGIDDPRFIYLLHSEARHAYFVLGESMGSEGLRLSSFFFHPNQFGHFLNVSFALVFPFMMISNSSRVRTRACVAIVLIIIGCILCQSRGSVILIILEGIAIAWYLGTVTLKKLSGVISVLVCALFLAFFLFPVNVAHFYKTRLPSTGLSFRDEIWANSIRLIPDFFLFGSGPGTSSHELMRRFPVVTYEQVFDSYHATGTYDLWANNSHNYYLATALECGIFSLIYQLALYSLIAHIAITRLKHERDNGYYPLLLGCVIAFLSEFVRGLFEAYCFLNAPETGVLLAFTIACILFKKNNKEFNPNERNILEQNE